MNPITDSVGPFDAPPRAQRAAGNPTALASDLLPLCDALSVVAATLFATLLHPVAPDAPDGTWVMLTAATFASFLLYDKDFGAVAVHAGHADLVRSHAVRLLRLTAVLLALGAASQTLSALTPGWLVTGVAVAAVLTLLTRVAMIRYLRRLAQRGALREAVAVVGAGPIADRLVRKLREAQPHGVELLGVFDHDGTASAPSIRDDMTGPVTGDVTALITLARSRRIDWIVLTLPAPQAALLQRLRGLGVPIGLCPQHVGLTLPHRTLDPWGDILTLGLLADRPIKPGDAVIKRASDILIGGVLTLLLLPLLALIAAAIRLDSPGPILFKQRRHTRNNDDFDIYKFRTMRWQPEAHSTRLQQTLRGDPRVTRIGRFLRSASLDELPQLFNVLRGHMSLVGPRPHALDMRTEGRLGCELTQAYVHRHQVKPGITGWAQVNGARGATEHAAQLHRRLELDLYYIAHWSLWLDLRILAMTPRAVCKKTNAF
jgi:Undecaprenyl-phosphate glucose phosphotransferase